eukprot:gene17185-20476_t
MIGLAPFSTDSVDESIPLQHNGSTTTTTTTTTTTNGHSNESGGSDSEKEEDQEMDNVQIDEEEAEDEEEEEEEQPQPKQHPLKQKQQVVLEDDFDSSEGQKESDDDYEPPSEQEDEEEEEQEDDDSDYVPPSSSRKKKTTTNTRAKRTNVKYDKNTFLMDDDESENDQDFVQESNSDSDSDYDPNPRKKKQRKGAVRKVNKPTRSSRRGRDDDDDWNTTTISRPVRERKQTVRLASELIDQGSDEEGADPMDASDNASDDDDDDQSYSSEDDSDAAPRRKATTKKAKKPEFESISFSNLRARTNDYSAMFGPSDEEDDDEMYVEAAPKAIGPVETTEDMIEKIVDHKLREEAQVDENETTFNVENYTFLVKWKGWANIHNTWDSYESLLNFKGNKKLINYVKISVIEKNHWRKEQASREDIEQDDIAREISRQEYLEGLKVERIIASREVEPTEENPTRIQYLVKWGATAYSEVTWEHPEDIIAYQGEIDAFLEREQALSSSKATTSVSVKKRLEQGFVKLEEQPAWINAGTLRDYQMEGLNWLVHSWINNINVILADEMGLGKTIQTISFISYLHVVQEIFGPFLVVVPLSTIENWQREFAKWAPQLNVVVYTGSSGSRDIIRQFEFYHTGKFGRKRISFNVLLTTYDFILKDRQHLGSIKWEYLAIDEAHRLKNAESMLHEVLKFFNTGNRLLVTGTPLQNSLKELWNLLNFLMPNKFTSLTEFQDQYSDLKEKDQIAELHNVLKPHLLRRIKKEVEKSLPAKSERILRVDLSPLQKKYYRWILSKNFQELNKGVKGEKTTLLNIVTENAEDMSVADPLDTLIKGSGKLILLDKLLVRLKETGHRVLIFSQMVRMLDILADYLKGRGFLFQRLDGSMGREKRSQAMDRFNAEGSPDFCFLLSTRAGGLGINLSTADTVIIFDSDWNPQNDLQAEARAHRIGQKNAVNIYRLVSKRTVEEEILERAKQKMVLDHLVIQSMEKTGVSAKSSSASVFNKDDLDAILRFGAEDLFKENEETNPMAEMDIDEILSRAETRVSNTETSAGEELLNSFKVANFSTGDTGPKEETNWASIIPDKDRINQANEEPLFLPPRRARTETNKSAAPKKASNQSVVITKNPKKVSWAIKWGPKEDAMLLMGIFKYGNGNWEAIHKDTTLGLESVISMGPADDQDTTKLKQAALQRRVDSLLKSAKESVISKTKAVVTTASGSATRQPLSKKRIRRPKEESDDDAEYDDDDFKTKKKVKSTTTSTRKVVSKASSIIEDSKHLEKFKELSDSTIQMSREDKVRKTKKYLLSLGNEISSVLDKNKQGRKDVLENHLWYYASQFTARGGDELKLLYNKMKKASQPDPNPPLKKK